MSWKSRILMPQDKANHFAWVCILTSIVFTLSSNIWLVILVGVIVSALVEIYDKVTKKGEYSALDFLYSVAGILPVATPTLVGTYL